MSTTANEARAIALKMKNLEAEWNQALLAGRPFVIRLDGVAFRTFTAGLGKPFDPRFTRAMLLTCRDLMDRCAARTAFCQSDEMSLVFGPEPSPTNIMYGGRVQKLASVMASMAAARFNHHMKSFSLLDWEAEPKPLDPEASKRCQSGLAFFDARVFGVPDETAAMEVLYWRHKYDLKRNVVNLVGFHLLGHESLQGQPITTVLGELRTSFGLDPFTAYPPASMLGAFLKRAQFDHIGFNPITRESVPTLRTRVEARTFDWEGPEEARTAMVMDRYWSPKHPASIEPISLD